MLPEPLLPRMVDAVLLDLDGTLSDAGEAIGVAVLLALQECGLDPVDPQVLRAFVGPPLEDSFAGLPGADAVVVERAVRAYRRHHDQLASPLYPGVRRLLETVRDRGISLALATSKPEPLAERVLAHHGLRGLFDVVAGSDRPNGVLTKADVVRVALDRLRCRAPVMVGDRRYDVEGAAQHGVPCVAVTWGYGSPEELAGAAAVVSDVDGLLSVLGLG